MKKNIWLEGMMGVVVGDALGCPVQFLSREEIKNRPEGPVTDMEAGGVYAMPQGTWTDDSSMALATMASIIDKGEVNPEDIMLQFVKWELKGEYTPFGEAFDQGNTCTSAIYKFIDLPDIKTCGATGEYANGNGALMRIMPVCLYYCAHSNEAGDASNAIDGSNASDGFKASDAIHIISGLTHNHLRSKMCCVVYYFCVKSIIDGITDYENRKEQWDSAPNHLHGQVQKPEKPELGTLLQAGVDAALKYYGRDIRNLTEMAYLGRLFHLTELKAEPEENIRSTGYVIDTIEAVFWCLLNTNSFKNCLLKAVNLGDDTDTVGAIAGGLAALYYGYESIPDEWLAVIKRRNWIEAMCSQMDHDAEIVDVPITDIHMHCRFGVDDGAKTSEMAMEMLKSSYRQGVRHIFCTSHDTAFESDPEKAKEAFSELKRRCAFEMPDLHLYDGCEIYLEPEFMPSIIENLRCEKYPSLNGTKYVLVEFYKSGINIDQVRYCLDVLINEGWIPVIAHCERYSFIFDGLQDIKTLKDVGCLVQINAYSLTEESNEVTRSLANDILNERLADFIGSDAHRTTHRPPKLLSGVREIYKRVDKEYADAICFKNAVKYLGIKLLG